LAIPPEVAHHRASRAANVRWSRPGERQRHGDKIADSKLRRHEALVDPDGTLDPAERRKLAENSLKAEMAALALKAAKARAARKGGDDAAA
jgi:hypothetical protein